MSGDILLSQEKEGVLTLRLNRPAKRNALNGALVEALSKAFLEAEEAEDVRVIVLRGEGSDFCAGADLAELERVSEVGDEANLEDARRLGRLLLQMRRLPRPVVGVVHGRALAGGCGLATACDLVLAREDSQLGYPEVHLGFVPAMVMAILRKKLTEGRAFELVALGERISAQEAHRIGLVNRVLPADGFDAAVAAFIRGLAAIPSSALSLTKGLLYEQADLSVADGVERGAQVNVEARRTEACREGVREFLAGKKSSPS